MIEKRRRAQKYVSEANELDLKLIKKLKNTYKSLNTTIKYAQRRIKQRNIFSLF